MNILSRYLKLFIFELPQKFYENYQSIFSKTGVAKLLEFHVVFCKLMYLYYFKSNWNRLLLTYPNRTTLNCLSEQFRDQWVE